MQQILMTPIGIVRSTRIQVADDHWDSFDSHIELDAEQFTADALLGLDDFSHAEVTFFLDQVAATSIEWGARHPRNNPALPKVGILAQRGKNRPNRIGHTIGKILRIDGLRLYLTGLDAVDSTPVLDIKPWFNEFGPRGEVKQAVWSKELMQKYW